MMAEVNCCLHATRSGVRHLGDETTPIENCRSPDQYLALTMAMMFEMGGHQVRTASSGEEALACVASYRPEVIVLDIGLPRINGYEVARRMGVMPETESALFVALTGYGQKADREAALEAGFDHHFVKPADPNNLLACIRDWSHTNANRCGQGLPSA